MLWEMLLECCEVSFVERLSSSQRFEYVLLLWELYFWNIVECPFVERLSSQRVL